MRVEVDQADIQNRNTVDRFLSLCFLESKKIRGCILQCSFAADFCMLSINGSFILQYTIHKVHRILPTFGMP